MVKRILPLFLSLLILFSAFPEFVPGKAVVAALDTDIITYADITVPAWGVTNDSYYIEGTYDSTSTQNTLTYQWSELKITNIIYNKRTYKMTYDIENFNYNADLYRVEGVGTWEANYQWNFTTGLEIFVTTPSDPHYAWGERFFYNYHYYGAPWVYNETVRAYMHLKKSGDFLEGTQLYTGQDMILTEEPTNLHFMYTISDSVSYPSWEGGRSIGSHWTRTEFDIPLKKNTAPTLSITTPSGQTLLNDAGLSSLNIEGYVQDADNNDVTLTAEVPNVLYKKITVPQAGSTKRFLIPIDSITDAIPPGDYTLTVKAVDPSNASASASMTFKVRQRLKRSMFVLINTPITNSTSYTDYEGDPKLAERYKYQHNPNYFDNSMGLLSDQETWRGSPYESFSLTGLYIATYQPRDNPKTDARFDEYRMWGKDNFTQLSFQVHRKPVALFSAKLVNGALQLADSSYDLDHINRPDKGLTAWQWQYKKGEEEIWTDGVPSGILSTTDLYTIRLRVRDVDGENSIGVWSDWCTQTVGAAAGNLPPVALFTVEPTIVSYRKATTIIDKSYDPDNDPLDTYQWSVVKDGWQTVWSYTGGASTPPNIASYGVGSYVLTLKVRDNRGLWSGAYNQTVKVMNHPPVANFIMPAEIYRDDVVAIENLTPNPDEDGDNVMFTWNAKYRGANYFVGNSSSQKLTVQNLINLYGFTPKQVVDNLWELHLTATDGSLSSTAARSFRVLNHAPAAAIQGPDTANQFDTIQYFSADLDADTADQGTLRYFWQVTDSSGQIKSYTTPNITMIFSETGTYRLEHWAIDQIGIKSNIASLDINVFPNLAPTMILNRPAGTVANPTILDAELQGDPLIEWTYSDPENDAQEKYRLEFFTKDSILAKSVENSDLTGWVRQYQVTNGTFERFKLFTVLGRAYSMNSWSDVSNERAFIIDNPPQPGFTLMTDTGRNAAVVPIYRTDKLTIQGTASDPDIPSGDSISYSYYLKPSGGSEGLAGSQSTFTKQFSTNGTFILRQVVTDSLGLSRELMQTITVANRIPVANITYPASSSQTVPTVTNTLTPVIKWGYQDEDGDKQQRYKVRVINLTTGAVTAQSGEQASSVQEWKVPAAVLTENQKYAVEVEVYDGFSWSGISPRKYFMVNLLTVQGGVRHTAEWNTNRQTYNMKKSGTAESPRGYSVFWAGESFVLRADTTGMPDSVEVSMTGGYHILLTPSDSSRTVWNGELYNSSFERLPDGPVTFTFTAKNAFSTKMDTVTVTIQGNWQDYFQSHRIK
ncbi:bacterial transduction protein [compost metagenome]